MIQKLEYHQRNFYQYYRAILLYLENISDMMYAMSLYYSYNPKILIKNSFIVTYLIAFK